MLHHQLFPKIASEATLNLLMPMFTPLNGEEQCDLRKIACPYFPARNEIPLLGI